MTTDFSLVMGGPFYRLLQRLRLSGPGLELLGRRVIVLSLFTWLPLLVLSLVDGKAWGGAIRIPFLADAETYARFLVALPLMLVAEVVANSRLGGIVKRFTERELIPEPARARFDAAKASALRLRNSTVAEVAIVLFVYTAGVLYIWRHHIAMDVPTWHSSQVGGVMRPSLAGWWLVGVSLPIFQFLYVRWLFRIFIWARFLWQVSRLGLHLIPTHPDRAGGIGFLRNVVYAFVPWLMAQGAMMSGILADRILFDGAALPQFKIELAGLVAVLTLVMLGPLLFFTPTLEKARRTGWSEYGTLAHRYMSGFDRKWLRGGAPKDEPLMGSADIQSMADMGNSYAVVQSMRVTPFSVQTIVQIAVITLVPVLPLVLTMFSVEQLVGRLLQMIF